MTGKIVLNFGCNMFSLGGFTNLDIDEKNNPDIVMDITKIKEYYEPNTIDFIYAGHFFEHIGWESGKKLMKDVHDLLKPFSSIVIVIPDYKKAAESESIEDAERIILNYGDHVALYNKERLEELAKQAGFRIYTELELERVPWILVPDINNPVPEKWQTALIATKVK